MSDMSKQVLLKIRRCTDMMYNIFKNQEKQNKINVSFRLFLA